VSPFNDHFSFYPTIRLPEAAPPRPDRVPERLRWLVRRM
jgi:hypothetical protein